MTPLTSTQSLRDESCRPYISTTSSSNGGGCHVPFSRHLSSHVRAPYRDSTASACFLKPLTSHSTIEQQIGLMCACMPSFPAIVKNSPTLQRCIHSVQNLGSWTLNPSRPSSTADTRRSNQKRFSLDGSVEDSLELHGRETSTEAVLPESPKKTPRMEL